MHSILDNIVLRGNQKVQEVFRTGQGFNCRRLFVLIYLPKLFLVSTFVLSLSIYNYKEKYTVTSFCYRESGDNLKITVLIMAVLGKTSLSLITWGELFVD